MGNLTINGSQKISIFLCKPFNLWVKFEPANFERFYLLLFHADFEEFDAKAGFRHVVLFSGATEGHAISNANHKHVTIKLKQHNCRHYDFGTVVAGVCHVMVPLFIMIYREPSRAARIVPNRIWINQMKQDSWLQACYMRLRDGTELPRECHWWARADWLT